MSDLKSLETKINTLIETCKRLAEENQSLNSERATLLEKNALAKTHIENMIKRLKILEEDQ